MATYAAPSRPPRAAQPRRTLHLLDIENLAGADRHDEAVLDLTVATYRRLVPVGDDDHVVVGCDCALAFPTTTVLPRARLVVGSGPDGADRALLASTSDLTFVARRYQRVVIGSGDHAFGPLASELRQRGIEVVVVSRSGSLSSALRCQASMVVRLDEGAPGVVGLPASAPAPAPSPSTASRPAVRSMAVAS